jgi:transposase InsO family protein
LCIYATAYSNPNTITYPLRHDHLDFQDGIYLWTDEGWLYLTVILDLFSRQVVGWSMQPHMRTKLVSDALRMAWFRRRPEAGLIVHSDRGSQYCSHDFQDLLKGYGMRSSMSRRGNCWDTQSKIASECRTDLTRAGIGQAAFALTCRSDSGVPRALPGSPSVT